MRRVGNWLIESSFQFSEFLTTDFSDCTEIVFSLFESILLLCATPEVYLGLMSKLIYGDETFQLIGKCYDVHRTLGPGFL